MIDWLKGINSTDRVLLVVIVVVVFIIGFSVVAINIFDIIKLIISIQ